MPDIITSTFQVPSLVATVGDPEVIVLTAELTSVSPETVGYMQTAKQYLDTANTEVGDALTRIADELTSRVSTRLGYRYQIKEPAGLAYTFELEDAGNLVRIDKTEPFTLTLPANVNVPYEEGTILTVRQAGIASIQLVQEDDVIVADPIGDLSTKTQHLGFALVKVGIDAWDMVRSLVGIPIDEVLAAIEDLESGIETQSEALIALTERHEALARSAASNTLELQENLRMLKAKVERLHPHDTEYD